MEGFIVVRKERANREPRTRSCRQPHFCPQVISFAVRLFALRVLTLLLNRFDFDSIASVCNCRCLQVPPSITSNHQDNAWQPCACVCHGHVRTRCTPLLHVEKPSINRVDKSFMPLLQHKSCLRSQVKAVGRSEVPTRGVSITSRLLPSHLDQKTFAEDCVIQSCSFISAVGSICPRTLAMTWFRSITQPLRP